MRSTLFPMVSRGVWLEWLLRWYLSLLDAHPASMMPAICQPLGSRWGWQGHRCGIWRRIACRRPLYQGPGAPRGRWRLTSGLPMPEGPHRMRHRVVDEVGIEHRGGDIGMAQRFLHQADIGGGSVKVCGERVPRLRVCPRAVCTAAHQAQRHRASDLL